MMHHIKALAVDIGPRGSTTENERLAAEYVAAELRCHTADVRIEPFRSFTSFSWPWGLIYLILVCSGVLLWLSPAWAAGFGLVGAALFIAQARARLELGSLFPHRPSQNIIGVLRPRGEVRRRVVVSGHLDTSRAALIFKPGQVETFRLSFLGMVASAIGLALLPLGALLWGGRGWAWISLIPTAVMAVSLLLLAHRELFGTYTHGANDNASGTAATLGVAETLAAAPLEHTEVWCLATGCEEVGAVGMKHFLNRYGAELAEADFIVLDNHGKGQVKYSLGEGMLGARACDPSLILLAEQVAREHPEWNTAPVYNTIMPTDMEPALVRGHRAIHLRAEDEKGLLPNWHWYTDVIENVDARNLEIVRDFTVALTQAIDQEAAVVRPSA